MSQPPAIAAVWQCRRLPARRRGGGLAGRPPEFWAGNEVSGELAGDPAPAAEVGRGALALLAGTSAAGADAQSAPACWGLAR